VSLVFPQKKNPTENSCTGNNQCATGFEDLLCSKCVDPDYARFSDTCVECDGSSAVFTAIYFVVVVVVWIVLHMCSVYLPNVGAVFIVLNFVQSMWVSKSSRSA